MAAGDFAFAAGHFSKAKHAETFVWSDGSETGFASSAPRQFLIRSTGGVGINTQSPQEALDVNGRIRTGTLTIGPWPANEVYVFVGASTLDHSDPGNYALLQGTEASGGHHGFTFLNSAKGIQFRIKNEDKMALDSDGNFVVFTDAFKPGGGAWSNHSDLRLKQYIRPLDGALEKLLDLHGVFYEWKDPAKQGNLPGPQMGMIAQDVEKVFPQWISTDADGYKVLTVRGFEALAIEAFRTLKAENEQLRTQNESLANRLITLEAKLMVKVSASNVQEGFLYNHTDRINHMHAIDQLL
jgi:hypothetical protein